jgi:DNA polymerase III subunit beta
MDSTNKLHLKLEVKDLIHALNFANSVVEKRNILAELSHIKLIASKEGLQIIATDMDLTLLQKVPAQIFEDGYSVVPSGMFTDIVRKIPDKEINLKQDLGKEQLEIIGKNCSFSLSTLPLNKFPSFEDMSPEGSFDITCKEFVKIIEHTQCSMSTEETRYNLNGIYLHSRKGNIAAAATDGHRLSVALSAPSDIQLNSLSCRQDEFKGEAAERTLVREHSRDPQNSLVNSLMNDAVPKEFGVILPRKTVQELLKITKNPHNIDSQLKIDIGINKSRFLCNNITMISKLIDGTFPEYDNFIPGDNSNILKINGKVLSDVIDRVSTVTIEKFKAVKITLSEKSVEITASGQDLGSAKEFINCDSSITYSGTEMSIGFNPRYLLDVLSAAKQENIEIHFKDPSSPALIKISQSPDDSFVIMPVKI